MVNYNMLWSVLIIKGQFMARCNQLWQLMVKYNMFRTVMTIKSQLQCMTCQWQTLSYNIVSSTPCQSGIRTDNVSGDKHWLHRYICSYKSNLPYDNEGTSLIQEDIGDFKYGLVYESTKTAPLHIQMLSFCDKVCLQ
jgi:hypothetical protein